MSLALSRVEMRVLEVCSNVRMLICSYSDDSWLFTLDQRD